MSDNNASIRPYMVRLDTKTRFLLSTSGSAGSIARNNKVLHELGMDLVYFSFDSPITAKDYAAMLRSPVVRGGAVTGQGLKSAIIPYLDRVEDIARTTRSVNTVVNDKGRLYGYNTDSSGLQSALRAHIGGKSGLKLKKAVIYGNGGVSGAAAHALQDMSMDVTMTGRDPVKVAAKMRQLGLKPSEGPYDLVVNATPASSEDIASAEGMLEALKGAKAVFDHNMPEKDGRPNHLRDYCEAKGIYFISGTEMYMSQMKRQWRLFLDGYIDGEAKKWSFTEDDIAKHWSSAD